MGFFDESAQVVRIGAITVHVARGHTTVLEDLPPRTVAVDGAVRGPGIDPDNERFSFDHHEDCVRHVTSASCQQVADAIAVGMDPARYTWLVNDVDGDTVAAIAVAAHPELLFDPDHADRVRSTIEAVGKVDALGPAWRPTPNQQQLLEQFWVAMRPERAARSGQTYRQCDLGELLRLCVDRVVAVFRGDPVPEIERPARPDGSWRIVNTGREGWVLAESTGPGFDVLYAAGFKAAMLCSRLPDGTLSCTIGKASEFVPFNVRAALDALSAIEPGWGGGSSIGGSPRNPDGSSSRLTFETLFEVVDSAAFPAR